MAKLSDKPGCVFTDKQMSKMVYVHMMELDLDIKQNKRISCIRKLTEIDTTIMLMEIRWTQRERYHSYSHV